MSYSPCWIPGLWMEVCNGQTDLLTRIESTIVHHYHNIGWSSWIILGANNFTEVITTFIIISESEDNKVPSEWIFWIRSTNIIVNDLTVLFNLIVSVFSSEFPTRTKASSSF